MEDFRVDRSQVVLAGVPSWMGAADRLVFAEDLRAEDRRPIHERGVLVDAVRAAAADPRVERVVDARRVLPNRIEITVDLRRPVAFMATVEGAFPVDANGVRLPGVGQPDLPVLHVNHEVVPAEGEVFGEAAVATAALVASLPDGLLRDLGLFTVTVAEPYQGVAVRFSRRATEDRGGVVVEWGRAPHAERASLDPPVNEKVERLRLAARRFPDLGGLRTVRLQFDDLIVLPR
jgi:hypothetical protein